MSSSNRKAIRCDAVLIHGRQPVGPLRLPIVRPEDFIEFFNRTYAGAGLSLQRVAEDDAELSKKKIPDGSQGAAGDHDLEARGGSD